MSQKVVSLVKPTIYLQGKINSITLDLCFKMLLVKIQVKPYIEVYVFSMLCLSTLQHRDNPIKIVSSILEK